MFNNFGNPSRQKEFEKTRFHIKGSIEMGPDFNIAFSSQCLADYYIRIEIFKTSFNCLMVCRVKIQFIFY